MCVCVSCSMKQQMYECMYVYLHTLTQLTNPSLKSYNKHVHRKKLSSNRKYIHYCQNQENVLSLVKFKTNLLINYSKQSERFQ